MKSVLECWEILESCLTLPESDLPKGVSLDAIHEFETATEISLPQSLRDFYLRHDGTGDCFFGPYEIGGGDQGFLSLQQSLGNWQSMCEIGSESEDLGMYGEQEGPVRKKHWHNKWIPLTDNGCGDYIYIDFDPDTNGTVGQIVDWWHEPAKSTFLYQSFSEFIDRIAENVQSGKYEFRLIA